MPDVNETLTAAGIALLADGKVLLLKRGTGGDYPGHWAFPGGKIEEGETPDEAARRETMEEAGYTVTGAMRQLSFTDSGNVQFTTFGKAVKEFLPALSDESDAFIWADPEKLPEPMHPGSQLLIHSGALDQINPAKMNELDIARAMAARELPSPQRYINMWLFDIRITGTGVAYRTAHGEFVFRDPGLYLNDDFLARCNGLQVIAEHPEKATLNSEEFADRTIGSVFLPYINGDEVWGIAKIYDAPCAFMMEKNQLSTSPNVVFSNPAVNSTAKLTDGAVLLIEGKPNLLDHVAICIQGVWDKGGPPTGVSTNNVQELQMTDEELKAKADAEAKEKADQEAEAKAKADSEANEKDDKLTKFMDAMMKRMDSFEAAIKKPDAAVDQSPGMGNPDKVKADAEAKEKEAAEAKAKADSEAEEKEKAKDRADAEEIRKAVADVQGRIPKSDSDADYAEMADCQAKADTAYSAFGDSAPGPMSGETVLSYRRRLANKLKAHSPAWREVDLYKQDATVMGIAEAQIFADAAVAAANPVGIPAGTLRTVEKRDSNGQLIRNFLGSPSAWMDEFKGFQMKQVGVDKGTR